MIDGFTIIDGHAHTYMDDLAERIITSFTALHMMEPSPSIRKGTYDDLADSMRNNVWT